MTDTISDARLGEILARAEPVARLAKRPVAFRVKDYADGWILFSDEAAAQAEADRMGGALFQGLYVLDGTPLTPTIAEDATEARRQALEEARAVAKNAVTAAEKDWRSAPPEEKSHHLWALDTARSIAKALAALSPSPSPAPAAEDATEARRQTTLGYVAIPQSWFDVLGDPSKRNTAEWWSALENLCQKRVDMLEGASPQSAPVEAEPVATMDPRTIIAGIRQFGLAADGSDLHDLEALYAHPPKVTEAMVEVRKPEELAGYVASGDYDYVHFGQDDATRDWTVRVGRKWFHGPTLAAAFTAALAGREQ